MARPKRDYLKTAHVMLQGHANWHLRHIDDAGYPSMTVEARLIEGGAESRPPPGPRVPNVMMPDSVAQVDRAMRVMPKDLYRHYFSYYRQGRRVPSRKLTETLIWVAGKLGY